MMRVANISEEARWGGPQYRITLVAERLKERGFETIVVLPKKDSGEFASHLRKSNIAYRCIKLSRLTRQRVALLRYAFSFIFEILSLIRLLKKMDVDVVHCNGSWQIKGLIAGRILGKKVIWHLNDTRAPRAVRIVCLMLAPLASGFIVASERTRQYYIKTKLLARKPLCEIQAPVNTDVFNPATVSPAQDFRCFNTLKVVTTANINPAKGLEYFLKAANLLRGNGSDATFLIAGAHFDSQRGYSAYLKGLIQKYGLDNVIFLGIRRDIPSVLKTADIYVCSSTMEGSPMSVWEAMAMGKPIVSTDVGDVARFIRNGENGFVVPAKNAAVMAEKVKILLENKKLRNSFGREARKVAVKYFDIKICTEKHAEFYKTVINS